MLLNLRFALYKFILMFAKFALALSYIFKKVAQFALAFYPCVLPILFLLAQFALAFYRLIFLIAKFALAHYNFYLRAHLWPAPSTESYCICMFLSSCHEKDIYHPVTRKRRWRYI